MKKETIEEQDSPDYGYVKDLVMTALGLSIIVGGIMITPNFPIVLSIILKILEKSPKGPVPKSKIKRVLKNLEKKELIYIDRKGEEAIITYTEEGKNLIKKYSVRSLFQLKKDKNKFWNGKWALVMFDIPEIQKNKRDSLRRLLLWLGFYPYQKSVYLYPYECRKEIELLKDMVLGGNYIRYMIAERLDDEKNAIRFFKL